MSSYQIRGIPGNLVVLPRIKNCADHRRNIFTVKESSAEQLYVWNYQDSRYKAQLSEYGSVIIRGNVLCTDLNANSFLRTIWKMDRRPVRRVSALIALFSQFQDNFFYGGYYDFVFLVLAKFCRIKDTFPGEDFSEFILSYPLFNTSYEKEYFQLMGVKTDHLIDSRLVKVVSSRLITGNSADWHPNIEDIFSLKRHIGDKVRPVRTSSDRIYISRSARRRIVNEKELIRMLKKFDFIIIEDKERSVAEQIAIYRNASFIMGPHGASFTNIIWCDPGTHLLELFSCNYAPNFYLYLANVMEMGYSAYYEDSADHTVDYLGGLIQDIHISLPKLEECLNRIFKPH